jgi:hypothetical protein
VLWIAFAVGFAEYAARLGSLIEAVNILGSLFYGTILGIFLAAFFAPRLRATPVFVAAIISEFLVFALWLTTGVGFLWFNLIGCVAVLVFAHVLGGLGRRDPRP